LIKPQENGAILFILKPRKLNLGDEKMNNLDIDPKKLKFIIYARKSTEGEDRQVASLDDQLEFAEGLAKKNSYKVIKTFREAASARKPHNRPKFDQMIKMLRGRKI